MFDLSWTEILVIGVAAIVFIGPKELPGALRTAGRFVSKARSMAREFQSNVEEMVRESELDELRKQVEKVQTGDYTRELEKSIDPKGEIASALKPPELPETPAQAAPPAPPAPPPPAAPSEAGEKPAPPPAQPSN